MKILKYTFLIFALALLASVIFYSYWNTASPKKTCISCHEISPAFQTWETSAHRNIRCTECHGTALSNGFHSMKEKLSMVLTHLNKKVLHENIGLSNAQRLETMERCKNCHQNEYANWKSSGHSATYASIFLDKKHNSTERLNFDCLRCHGMFFAGTINDLVTPIDKTGPWQLKHQELIDKATIPCFACHQIHFEGTPETSPNYSNPAQIAENRIKENYRAGFFDRTEKVFFQATALPKPKLFDGERAVKISDDKLQHICNQCHAPNSWHQSGTSDDRTTVGVHEGLSCNSCHEKHSNKSQKSCAICHPALSNCGLDVTKMNTTYFDSKSKNNIHFVKCANCHKDGREGKMKKN